MSSDEIRKMEEAGIKVISVNPEGRINYATERNGSSKCCDLCSFLRFEPDPDPNDWMRDTDQKAICTALNAKIAGSLEPRELTNISKPLYCPRLGRQLTDEEKAIAERDLAWAKKNRG